MSTVMVPANMPEALAMLEGALGFLADMDAAGMPAQGPVGRAPRRRAGKTIRSHSPPPRAG